MTPIFVVLTNTGEDQAGATCANPVVVNVSDIVMAITWIQDKKTRLFTSRVNGEEFIVVQESPTEVYAKITDAIQRAYPSTNPHMVMR